MFNREARLRQEPSRSVTEITDMLKSIKNSFSFIGVFDKGFQPVRKSEMGKLSLILLEKFNIKKQVDVISSQDRNMCSTKINDHDKNWETLWKALGVRMIGSQISPLPFRGWVKFSKTLKRPKPQFPHLQRRVTEPGLQGNCKV